MWRVPGELFGVLYLRAEPALLPAVIGQDPGVFRNVICQTNWGRAFKKGNAWSLDFWVQHKGKIISISISIFLHLFLYIYRYIFDKLSVIAWKHLGLGKISKLFLTVYYTIALIFVCRWTCTPALKFEMLITAMQIIKNLSYWGQKP